MSVIKMYGKKEVKEDFNQSSDGYEHYAFRKSLGLRYLDTLEKNIFLKDLTLNDKVICEVGVGVGRLSREIFRLNDDITYIGLDISEKMLKHAQKGIPLNNFHPIVADAENIPIKADAVDFILCIRVLKYVPRYQKSLKNMRRMLKPNGHLVLHIQNSRSIIELLDHRFLSKHKIDQTFTMDQMKQALKNAGFYVYEINYYGFLPNPLLSRLNNEIVVRFLYTTEQVINGLPQKLSQIFLKFIVLKCKAIN